jgi:hypothetical protein
MTFQADVGRSPSGVQIANDFRDNLIIDRYDPVFADMRASKLKHMKSVNSEDAVTWNVFRSLRQINPTLWLPPLWIRAFPEAAPLEDTLATVRLWVSVPPPLGLIESGDEGHSEIDVVIETATWVWFIEAKYRSDISAGTTTRPDRDQVLRNIDVGSYYAGVRQFFFSLLTASNTRSRAGDKALAHYSNHSTLRGRLKAHRKDGLKNLGDLGPLKWFDLYEVLRRAAGEVGREDEKAYASRALAWLGDKGLGAPQ